MNYKDILGSEKFECFSIAFLYHAILLSILLLIVSSVKNNQVENILIITNDETQPVELETNLPDIVQFTPEETSISNEPINLQESSLNVDPDMLIPSSIEIDEVSDIKSDLSSDFIGETISGIGDNIGSGTSNESSTGGALDRLTLEIINSGQQKNTHVIWLMDASLSLSKQRENIRDRIEKILQEISYANTTYDITHSIASFGKELSIITKSKTKDSTILKADIDSIKLDSSGIENTFHAIGTISNQQKEYGSRLLIIVFTDEVGDDQSILDDVANLCRRQGTMIYIVGSPAPFGKSTTQFRFVEFDPQYSSTEKWAEIHQGPETLSTMLLNLQSLPIDKEVFDSGYGPFALSKLCLDTGGIYFSVHPDRKDGKVDKKQISPLASYISRFFDHDTMMKYKPDYRSIGIQQRENNHITKSALLKACQIPLQILDNQTLKFKAYNEGSFAEELNLAQRFSAKIEPKVNEIYNILQTGENASKTLVDNRWIASYNLAIGRILSTKCRIELYNLMLAEAKSGLKKKDPKSNIWTLIPSNEFDTSNSVLNKYHKSSRSYLNYVVENFPNTPWALLAKEELDYPIGYKWEEGYEPPPQNNGGGNGNNNPKDDMKRNLPPPKPQRKIDKI